MLAALFACGPGSTPASPAPSVSPPPADGERAPATARSTPPPADGPVDVSVPRAAPSAASSVAEGPSARPPVLDPPCKHRKGAALDDVPAPFWDPWDMAPTAPERGVLGLPAPPLARIPPEVVRRPIRERFRCFAACYEQGLARKPDLHGRVVVDFTIEAGSGKVKSPVDRGSTLPDRAVIGCILDEMKLVRFPAPEDKDVRVVYPMSFLSEQQAGAWVPK